MKFKKYYLEEVSSSVIRNLKSFFDTGWGQNVDKALGGKLDRSKLEKNYFDKYDGRKYANILDAVLKRMGMDPIKYKTGQDSEDAIWNWLKQNYLIYIKHKKEILDEAKQEVLFKSKITKLKELLNQY